MKSHRSLYSLLLLLLISWAVATSAQDEDAGAVVEAVTTTAAEEDVTTAKGKSPKSPTSGITETAGSENAPATPTAERDVTPTANEGTSASAPKEERHAEPEFTASALQTNATESKCKPNEILTATKGCVDRNDYLQRVMLKTWDNEALDELKTKAGLDNSVECKENEILTAFGCSPVKQPLRSLDRADVVASRLFGEEVFKSHDPIPAAVASNEAELTEGHEPANPRAYNKLHASDHGTQGNRPPPFSGNVPAGHVTGHNRARAFVILPGRRLVSDRKCRPYEVLTSQKRCILKRGKVGIYEHKDHKYYLQRRHRHNKGTA